MIFIRRPIKKPCRPGQALPLVIVTVSVTLSGEIWISNQERSLNTLCEQFAGEPRPHEGVANFVPAAMNIADPL